MQQWRIMSIYGYVQRARRRTMRLERTDLEGSISGVRSPRRDITRRGRREARREKQNPRRLSG
jgi:hypothetical protein